MFAAIYDSAWHSPLLFWLCGGLTLLLVCARLPFLPAFCVLFTFNTCADVLSTGALSVYPPAVAAGPWPQRLAIAFVVLGDWRFFLLVERALCWERPRTPPGAHLRAALLALIPSLASLPLLALLPRLLPHLPAGRLIFLTYEVLFLLVLPLWWRLLVLPRARALDPALRRFLRALLAFEALQYGSWALADVIILAGYDAGFALRLVPNTLYYAAFVPFAYLLAPPVLRQAGGEPRAATEGLGVALPVQVGS